MRPLVVLLSLLGATALISDRLHAQNPDAALQQVVDRFYPVERLHPATDGERYACYQVLRTAAANEPALVLAAYTDRSAGAIRVLRRNAAGAFEVVEDNPASWVPPGTDCRIRAEDLDVDGQQEAIVYFLGVRASPGWVLKWDGAKLLNLTPTRIDRDRESSLLLSPAVYDLEHTGSLRIIAAREIDPPGSRPRSPAFVYRLGPSRYEMEKGILAVMGFRADVDPRSNMRTFGLVQDSVQPWRLRVINGDRSGKNRVTGATIHINGQEVTGPWNVNERTEFTTTMIPSLGAVNRVTATLTGADEAFITVLVEDSTQR